jgi:nitrite reductase/ring-hydroxylating ferredoxin subunit
MDTRDDGIHPLTCEDDSCAGRAGEATRRGFLQTAGCFGAALVLLGVASSTGEALPVFMTEGVADGGEKRYPIPAADSVNVDRTSSLIVVRTQGHVYVFSLSCPHENNAVKWVAKDRRFQCTKHDSRYQPDGVHTSGRATRNMDRYVIRRDGDSIVVDLHRWVQSDKDLAAWTAATITV